MYVALISFRGGHLLTNHADTPIPNRPTAARLPKRTDHIPTDTQPNTAGKWLSYSHKHILTASHRPTPSQKGGYRPQCLFDQPRVPLERLHCIPRYITSRRDFQFRGKQSADRY
jgi:hypothetical protein